MARKNGLIKESGTVNRVKDQEKTLVYSKIFSGPNVTRSSLTKKYRLRPSTVSLIVQELLDDRIVVEGEVKNAGTKGRPEKSLRVNYNRYVAVSLAIGPRMMIGLLLNMNDELLSKEEMYTRIDGTNEYFLDNCKDIVRKLLKSKPKGADFLGTGVSVIGRIDNLNRVWVLSARYPEVDNLDFKELKKSTRKPVRVRRNIDVALEYLITHNSEYRTKNICLIYWGENMLLSYSSNGNIIGSNIGRFGEFGHMKVAGNDGKVCECGTYGCKVPAGSTYGCLLSQASVQGVFDDVVKRLGREELSLETLTDDEMFELLKTPELIEVHSVKRAVGLVGVTLNSVFNIFYPDLIICMGPFVENEKLFNVLQKEFFHSISEYDRNNVELNVLYDGYKKEINSNVLPFFETKLEKMLKARF